MLPDRPEAIHCPHPDGRGGVPVRLVVLSFDAPRFTREDGIVQLGAGFEKPYAVAPVAAE